MILQSGQSLLSIINDILDFSKIEAGKMSLDPIPTDLRGTAEEVVTLLSQQANEKGLPLLLRYAPRAPRHVLVDPGRIRQILANLIGNAIKFTQDGHVFLDIDISGNSVHNAAVPTPPGAQNKEAPATNAVPYSESVTLTFSVADNQAVARGVLNRFGIEPKIVGDGEQVLRAFQKSRPDILFMDCAMPLMDGFEATRRIRQLEPPGTHVPIIAMTAHAIEGAREECLAAGMDDYMSKPIHPNRVEGMLLRYCPGIQREVEDPDMSILIVEDDRNVRNFLEERLRHALPGAQICSVVDGLQACTLLDSFQPTLILTDLLMQGMDGVAFLKMIRENRKYQHIKTVILTALSKLDEKVLMVRGLGVGQILFKPCPIQTILDKVLELHRVTVKGQRLPLPPSRDEVLTIHTANGDTDSASATIPVATTVYDPRQLNDLFPDNEAA